MKQIHVLFVEASPSGSYGGSKRFLTNLIGCLDPGRWNMHVIFYRGGPFVEDIERRGATVTLAENLLKQVSAPRNHRTDLGLIKDTAGGVERTFLRRTAWNLRSMLNFWIGDRARMVRLSPHLPERIDLIHCNNPMHTDYAWPHLAMRLRVPFLTRENVVWRTPPWAFREVARRAGALVCLTEERERQVVRFCGFEPATVVIPNGVDPAPFRKARDRRETRAALGIAEHIPVLLTPSHLQRAKGQHLAVEAAERLRDAGVEFRWFLCGAEVDPVYGGEVRRAIIEGGLEPFVHLLGERDDMIDIYAASDLTIHTPTQPAPFDNVVLESMAAGTPVVGPSEGANPTVIRPSVDGLLYEPRSVASMVEAVRKLIDDPTSRRRMGDAARDSVQRRFTLDQVAAAHAQLYERCVGHGG